MKRRVAAGRRARRSDEDTTIPATRRAMNGVSTRQLDPAETDLDIAGHTWPNRIHQLQRRAESRKRQAQFDLYLRHDRETIFFLVLAILGAAFVVIACFTLNIMSVASFSRFINISSFSLDRTSNHGSEKDDRTTHSTPIKFDPKKTVFFPTHLDDHDYIINKNYYFPHNFAGLKLELKPMSEDDNVFYDYVDDYYAFDDDHQRNPFKNKNEADKQCCRRISEHRLYFPNCNTFHETSMKDSGAIIVGSGAYRQAMIMEIPFGQEIETVVVKDIHAEFDLGHSHHEYTRMDAIVAERLTASPRIYNIYGTCGIGIISEYFEQGQVEQIAIPTDDIDYSHEDEKGPLVCYNDLTALMKLKLSLQMAEALADLHGYPGGPIVHQDVKLDQYFFSADMSQVILSDFNRAEFLLWDHCNEKYCGYQEGYGGGNWRSPEEYYDEYLTEKVDVYSHGNNMYSLLTGMMVFHGYDIPEVQELVGHGERPFIDPRFKERSLAEAKLVEIIEKCHEYLEKDRPSIFEVVGFLRHALKEVEDTIEDDGNP